MCVEILIDCERRKIISLTKVQLTHTHTELPFELGQIVKKVEEVECSFTNRQLEISTKSWVGPPKRGKNLKVALLVTSVTYVT
jgi:hypothetical protein